MAINVCNRCYVFEIGSTCITSGDRITVYVENDNYNYSFWLTDKFGNYWVQDTSSWNDYHLELDLGVFPEGMFTEFSGTYEVTVSESTTSNEPVVFTVNGVEYDCFIIKFIKTSHV